MEKDALHKGLASREASGTESPDAGAFDPSQSRFDQALELAASTQNGPETVETDAEILLATSGMETVLRRFAEAKRRRYENKLAEWKEQLKRATMIVINKQV